jgi:hypothetical protein
MDSESLAATPIRAVQVSIISGSEFSGRCVSFFKPQHRNVSATEPSETKLLDIFAFHHRPGPIAPFYIGLCPHSSPIGEKSIIFQIFGRIDPECDARSKSSRLATRALARRIL